MAYLLSDLGGGTGHHLFSVLRARPEQAWSARILSEAENTARIDSPAPLETLPRPHIRRYPFAQVERFFQLRRRLAREAPDILHTYFFWSIVYGRLLKASGVISRLVENREDLGFNWGRHEYALLGLTHRMPDRVVCVSEAVRRHVIVRERLDPTRVVVIRNGIPAPPPAMPQARTTVREELGIPRSSPIVGMVANFNRPIKGAVYFVDALPLVAKEIAGVYFLLIGLGDNEAELRERAESAGVADRLIFTGFRTDIERLYEAMDVAALTSLSEGLSITLLEAMRHGLPVVATRVGGNPEVVLDGETGFLVPPGDPQEFASHVVRLLTDGELRERFAQKAKERIEKSFNLDDVADAYGALYASLAPATK